MKIATTPPLTQPELDFLKTVEDTAISYSVLTACVDLEVNPILANHTSPDYASYKRAIASTHDIGEKLRVWAMRMAKEKWLPSSEEEIQSAINLTAVGYHHLLDYIAYYNCYIGSFDFKGVPNEVDRLTDARNSLDTLRDTLIGYKQSFKAQKQHNW